MKDQNKKITITTQIASATNKRLNEFCEKHDHKKGGIIERAVVEYLQRAEVANEA